jgi:hypothetical protein
MSAKNKRKGASFELDVMKWFRSKGVNAERLRLSGQKDEGDLVVIVAGKTFILELKNTKSMDLPQFWREATVEAQNYASARGITPAPLSYIVVKRRSAGIEKAWVVQDLTQWLEEKNASA